MEIKIYFEEKPIFLCDSLSPESAERTKHPDTILIDELSTHAINALIHEIRKESFHAGILIHKDMDAMKQMFFRHFTCIEAAGGIVKNNKEEILFIFRRGKWDLPKGKLEAIELPDSCAAREITEETGITNLILHQKLGETYHIYDAFGKHYLKTSHWYYFTCPSGQTAKAQTEEDITEVKWFPLTECKKPLENTYATIRDIVNNSISGLG